MNKEISFIIEFDEMNKKQQNALWNYLLSSGFKWHVLKGNDDFIENANLKQALIDIRDKIKDKGQRHQMAVLEQMCVEDFCLDGYECGDILQIIDKAIGDENNEW